MFDTFILFLKALLYGPAPTEPTAEQVAEFDAHEDTHGYSGWPTPWEQYHDEFEMRERALANPLRILVRWRIATMHVPFTKGNRFVFPRFVSRAIHPGAKLHF